MRTLKEFSVDHLVEAVARSLRAINPSFDLPTSLPAEMSGRYRIGSALAAACQELGYRGELGYHQFLYPSEAETRRILLFLLEAMPKMGKKEEQEVAGSAIIMSRAIAAEAAERLKSTWAPPLAQPNALYVSAKNPASWHYRSARAFRDLATVSLSVPDYNGLVSVQVSKDVRRFHESPFSRLVTAQCPSKRDVAASLLESNDEEITAAADWDAEWNSHGLQSGLSKEEYRNRKRNRLRAMMGDQLKSAMQRVVRDDAASLDLRSQDHLKNITSRFSNQAKFAAELETPTAAAAGETEEEIANRRSAELQELRDRLAALTDQINDLNKNTDGYEVSIKQLEARLVEERGLKDELETAYKVKKRVLDLLADPDGSIAMLNGQLDAASARIMELSGQWETRRGQMIAMHRDLAAQRASRMSESQVKVQKINEMRAQMKVFAEEARERNEFYKTLAEEYERLNKEKQRPQYTERIMEIVRNVKKQNREIDKVLNDTRSVQREISQLIATLDRSYTATDELIYRDAKVNEFSKRCYKLLVNIHELFAELVKVVEETGSLRNIARDLEDKIDQLNTAKTAANLAKITGDLEMVIKENSDLQHQIKKKGLGVE